DGGVVEIFAPDERRELAQELLARFAVARSDSRLDERGPLLALAEALVIGEACIGRERDLRCPRIRAQTKIGAKRVAVRGMLLEKPHQLARQFHEESRRIDIGLKTSALGVVKDDDVDIA